MRQTYSGLPALFAALRRCLALRRLSNSLAALLGRLLFLLASHSTEGEKIRTIIYYNTDKRISVKKFCTA